jgi:hypothetical protein
LGERDEVQRQVELTIAAAGKAASCAVAAGDFDGCDAGVVGER